MIPPCSRSRTGFTLIEMVVALGLGILVLLAALALADVTGTQRQLTEQQSDLISNGLSVDAALERDLRKAGRGLIAAHNLSGLRVDTATVGGTPADTLTVLWGVGAAFENSVYGCQSGASDCMAIVDQAADTLEAGDLVVTGNPNTGARLFEVGSVSPPYTASCGADCSGESLSCSTLADGDLNDQIVTGSTLYDSGGTVLSTSSQPCEQPYWPNGNYCEETTTLSVEGTATTSACAAVASDTLTYRDVSYIDRTGRFGYPGQMTFTRRSGNDGTPQVRTRRIAFARYFLRLAATAHPTLVKQTAWDAAAGDFGPALPVAGDVTRFRVEVQHEGQTTLTRGVGVEAGDLAFDEITNPNFTRNPPPGPGEIHPGFTFTTSYRTVAAVRVTYRVRTRDTYEGSQELGQVERAKVDLSTVVATPQILGGGAGLVRLR